MDPTTNLKELRKLVKVISRSNDLAYWNGNLNRMLELFQSLDSWITKGGALPDDWINWRDMK